MADAARLKSAVYRATNDDGDGDGDPAAMVEVDQILKDHPELIMEGVKYIKARIKDKSLTVSMISLNLLDQCMQSNGFQFQVYVIKKVLQRVLKNAYYNKGTPVNVQQKCANLIREWAATYGADARMKEFVEAKKELDRQEEKSLVRQASGSLQTPPLRSLQGGERARSPQGYGNGMALRSPTNQPGYGQHGMHMRSPHNQPTYGQHGMLPPFPDIDPSMLQDGAGQQQMMGSLNANMLSQQRAVNVVDLDQARENCALLSQMLAAETGSVAQNEVLAEVAVLCKGCQVGIMSQIETVEDEARLSDFLSINDRLSDVIGQYEKALTQTNRGNRVLEADTTMSDGRALQNQASPPAPSRTPPAHEAGQAGHYNEEDELAKALAESAQMAKDRDFKELNDVFGGGGDHVSDVTQVNYTRENYGESNASAINQRQVHERDAELNALFGKPEAPPPPPVAPVLAPPRASGQSTIMLDELAGLNFGTPPPAHAPNTMPAAPPQAAQALRMAITHAPLPPVDDPFLALSNASSPPPLPAPPVPVAPPRANPSSTGLAHSPPPAASPPAAASTMPSPPSAGLARTGGATAEQITMWFARLSANREGVLFEDTVVQIGVKTQYQGNKGRVQLYIGNKSSAPLSDFALQASWLNGLTGLLTIGGTGAPVPPSSVVEPRQQMQINVDVVAAKPFEGSPPLVVSYTSANSHVAMEIQLPVVASKFVEAVHMARQDFEVAWGKLLFCGEAILIQSSDKWMKNETLRALVSNGIHFGLVESETEICMGSGKFKGAEQEKTVMLQATVDRDAKTATITVRAESAELRIALEKQLVLLLSGKK